MRTLLALLALPLLLACGNDVAPPEPAGGGVPPDTFRAVLVELALARVAALPDTQAWHTRREAILDRHGLDARAMRNFVEAYGTHDEVMESIYRELGSALDSVARRSAAGDTAGASVFPSAEDAARSAGRAGEAVPDTAP